MSKTVTLSSQLVRLVVPAGKATAAPPIGPALGARGVKSIDFVKEFNARTSHLIPGTPTPVLITISPDRSFTFILKSPPTTFLIKQAAGLTLGSGETPKIMVGKINVKQVWEIVRIKCELGDAGDGMKGLAREGVARSVVGTCRSLGVEVVI